MRRYLQAGLLALAAGVAHADGSALSVAFEGSFEDATFAVESAIIGRGLVIDHVSHVGDMLSRTGADVGSNAALFDKADVFVFCSAVVSRAVMEADPMNIAHCPYGVFVTDRGGAVRIGYRSYPQGAMQQVQSLLAEITAEAAEN